MHSIRISKFEVLIPSTWNELTAGQLVYISRLFNSKCTVIEFKVVVLHKFLSVNKRLWHYLSAVDIYNLGHSLSFLFEEVNLTRSLIKTTRSKRFPFPRYYGPADGLSTSTFGEFTKAQVRYEQYCQTKNPDSLNELVAILYRRKRLFWFINRHFTESPDPRVRFWDRTLLARTRHIASIPDETKYAIFLFFSGVMGSLPATFPNVYKPKPSSKTTGQNSWSTLIISLADGKTDDESLNRIMNSNLYNVFLGMEQKSIEYFEFLKKHPAND